MSQHNTLKLMSLTAVSMLLTAQSPGFATVGLAEWAVYTPGRNMITHSDSWMDVCGAICLKADDSLPSPQRDQLYVKSLLRWRYYKNRVAGQSRAGFFLFNEVTKQVTHYKTEVALLQAIKQQQIGAPISKWLVGQDGWDESWAPFFWSRCKPFLSPQSSTLKPSIRIDPNMKAECTRMFAANLTLFRQTTWGVLCQKWQQENTLKASAELDLSGFCTYVKGSPESRNPERPGLLPRSQNR